MSIAKTVMQWAAIFLALVFLPHENRLILFDVKPSDWYGEIRISSENEHYILAKNSADKIIDPQIPNAKSISIQPTERSGFLTSGQVKISPQSLNIIQIDSNSGLPIYDRKAVFDGKVRFHPGPLSVWTSSDLYYGYVLISSLIAAFSILGFLIARFDVEKHSEAPNRE